jgi:hypothetical protein
VTKRVHYLVLLLIVITQDLTAQISENLVGHIGVSTIYQPPYQSFYRPIGLDIVNFKPTIKLRINAEAAYNINSRIELNVGVGLGNADLRGTGLSLNPEIIELVDSEFNPESLAAFNKEQYSLFNTSFDHAFASIGGYFSLGRSEKSINIGFKGYLPYYYDKDLIGSHPYAEYEDVAAVYKYNYSPDYTLEFLLRKRVVIFKQNALISFSAIYSPNDHFVTAWTLMETNRVTSFNINEYPFPDWNYGLTLSCPLF